MGARTRRVQASSPGRRARVCVRLGAIAASALLGAACASAPEPSRTPAELDGEHHDLRVDVVRQPNRPAGRVCWKHEHHWHCRATGYHGRGHRRY